MAYIRAACTLIASSVIVFIFAGIADSKERNLQSAKIWFDKGMLFREAGDPRSNDSFQQAIKDLDGYIESDGNVPQDLARAYTLRARCQNLLGNDEQAIQDLDKAIELSSGDGDIYYLRSYIHEIMGHSQLSVDDLQASARKGNEKAKDELKIKRIQWWQND